MPPFPIVLALLLVSWAYLAPVWKMPARTSPRPVDYYGYLTEAFHAGQLHLNIAVDPKLLALTNPYAGPQGAMRPHDMSYYRGRFYLYYGATPALILYLPWRLLTGTYLDEPVGTTLMLWSGFLLAAAWIIRAWRRWFPDLSARWPGLLILTLGLSPPLITESSNGTFYAVPIAAAFLCLMLAATGAERALSAASLPRQAAWLAFASLFWGLSVGARPIYVLGLVVLAIPAAWLWWQSGREARWKWPGLRLLAATIVPAAVIGVAIMTYNFMRFDNPVDFGIRFSLASGDVREARFMGLEFIPKNLALYVLHPAAFIRYYPFIMTAGRPWGILPHLPFAFLAFLFPFSWMDRRLRQRPWVLSGLLLLGAAIANFTVLCLFFGGEERYLVDFVPGMLLLGSVVALVGLDAARRTSRRSWRWMLRSLVVVLTTYAIATGLTLALPRHETTTNLLWLERLVNTPTYWLEQVAGTRHGPVALTVRFPRGRTGAYEPLVTTSYGREYGDAVVVRYVDDTHVQFSAFHVGRGGPVSEPIKIDYGAPHRLRIAIGSLYPPAGHPLFADWPPALVTRVHRRLKIELDGQTALQGNLANYDSVPSCILIGRSTLAPNVCGPVFTGEILARQHLGFDRAEVAGFEQSGGPVRLTLRFPPRSGDEGLPLVATGNLGGGDLVFVQLLKGNRLRFGHDSFGAGAVFSPTSEYDPDRDQVVEVEMGSLYPPGSATDILRRRLRITLNGEPLIDTPRPFNPSSPDEVEFGFNTIRASTAIEYFPGAIRRIERIDPYQPGAGEPKWGYLRLEVMFPPNATPVAEPLVVTGHTGRADLLYVRYGADGTVRFGLDHWGVGGAMSEPLPIDRNQKHLIEVLSGALLPPKGDPHWAGHDPVEAGRLRRRFEVRFDGRTVFTPDFTPYPNESAETQIGKNLIGASTCEPAFSGQLLLVKRMPWK